MRRAIADGKERRTYGHEAAPHVALEKADGALWALGERPAPAAEVA